MARRHPRRGGRATPRGTRPAAAPRSRTADFEPPFVGDVRECLREESPFLLFSLASTMIEESTPRPLDGWRGRDEEPVDGPALFADLAESEFPEVRALVLAIATLHPDEVLARRLRSLVERHRSLRAPNWLSTMGDITIGDTYVQSDPLGDGENLVVPWRWPDGQPATLVVYIDHNMGTAVKDAFVIPEDAAIVFAAAASAGGSPHIVTTSIAPADARARIVEGIELTERMIPPVESEAWPLVRPYVEWVLRRLPAGGKGYVRPDWSDAERERLLDDFSRSVHAARTGLSRPQVRDLASPFLWFACDYGPGDPLRWSPSSVEIFLADWYARKVFGVSQKEMRRIPDLLVGFVRFAHERKDIPAELTDDTLATIEHLRRAFIATIMRPGRSPADGAARIARLAAGFRDEDVDDFEDFDDFDDFDDDVDEDEFSGLFDHAGGIDPVAMNRLTDTLEAELIARVGGQAAYEALDDTPLGDVPVDWSIIPEPLRAQTTATAQLLDGWAVELFDAEVRTIARHVLAGVVRADPAILTRSDRVDAIAAGILWFLRGWLTERISRDVLLGLSWRDRLQKELAAATGVSASTISNRARTISNVVRRADIDWSAILHSAQRRDALLTRRIIREWRDTHP